MDIGDLIARYGALGDERDFLAATSLFEQAVADAEVDARLLNDYGFMLESHGRNELRRAVALYERAIELDPAFDKPHYQLISARAGLCEAEDAVRVYEARLAARPDDVREYRFLAQAYLVAHAYLQALEVADAGLALAQDDAALLGSRGAAKAGLGDVEGALADWRRSLELDPEDISGLYESAFLLEREGRLAESTDRWQAIIDWCQTRGLADDAVWPKQERARLFAALGASSGT